MKLAQHASTVFVDAKNPHDEANNIIASCRQANVKQVNWNQSTKNVVQKGEPKKDANKVRAREMVYVMSKKAYTALRNCEFLQNKKHAKHLTEQQIIDELNASTNPPAEITSYILTN